MSQQTGVAVKINQNSSISSYSEMLKQIQYGKNKEHDRLAQLNLLLVFGEESGLPFYYRKLAGNIPDAKTVKNLLPIWMSSV